MKTKKYFIQESQVRVAKSNVSSARATNQNGDCNSPENQNIFKNKREK